MKARLCSSVCRHQPLWRCWLRVNEIVLDPSPTHQILPEVMTVEARLQALKSGGTLALSG
jgi:hypothetical protein